MEMYLKGLDFCMEKNFPDNNFIRKHFKGSMEEFGVHLDDTIDVLNPKRLVALGSTSGVVTVNKFAVAQITVNNDADITIKAQDNSFVMVDVWGNANVRVYSSGSARVRANRHSSRCNVGVDQRDESDTIVRKKFEGSNLPQTDI